MHAALWLDEPATSYPWLLSRLEGFGSGDAWPTQSDVVQRAENTNCQWGGLLELNWWERCSMHHECWRGKLLVTPSCLLLLADLPYGPTALCCYAFEQPTLQVGRVLGHLQPKSPEVLVHSQVLATGSPVVPTQTNTDRLRLQDCEPAELSKYVVAAAAAVQRPRSPPTGCAAQTPAADVSEAEARILRGAADLMQHFGAERRARVLQLLAFVLPPPVSDILMRRAATLLYVRTPAAHFEDTMSSATYPNSRIGCYQGFSYMSYAASSAAVKRALHTSVLQSQHGSFLELSLAPGLSRLVVPEVAPRETEDAPMETEETQGEVAAQAAMAEGAARAHGAEGVPEVASEVASDGPEGAPDGQAGGEALMAEGAAMEEGRAEVKEDGGAVGYPDCYFCPYTHCPFPACQGAVLRQLPPRRIQVIGTVFMKGAFAYEAVCPQCEVGFGCWDYEANEGVEIYGDVGLTQAALAELSDKAGRFQAPGTAAEDLLKGALKQIFGSPDYEALPAYEEQVLRASSNTARTAHVWGQGAHSAVLPP